MFCEILKSGPLELLQSKISDFIAFAEAVDAQKTLISNTIVRKLKTKLISRVGLRLLPSKFGARRARGMGQLGIHVLGDLKIPQAASWLVTVPFNNLK